MKRLATLLLGLFTILINAQTGYQTNRQVGALGTTDTYLINSPGNTPSNSRLLARYKDSTEAAYYYNNYKFSIYNSSRNDGTPNNIAWFDANGNLKRSNLPNWLLAEVDPGVSAYAKSLTSFNIIKTDTDALYEPTFSKNTGFNKNLGNSAGTVAEGNDSRIINGQAAYAALPNYLLTSIANSTYQPIGAYITNLSSFTTNSLAEGGSNLYYTASRFNTAFGAKSTTDLAEGTNQYFTTARARASVSGTAGVSYSSSTGVISLTKRQEPYSGSSNGSGVYTVTFGTAYSVAPNIQASWIGATDTQNLRISSVSTTGFTILARNRVDALGLLPTWVNVSGATIDVLITEK